MSKDKVKRLEKAREKLEEISRKKDRLSGQLEERKRTIEQLKKRAEDEFECEVNEIPDIIKSLEEETEKALREAERLLGVD